MSKLKTKSQKLKLNNFLNIDLEKISQKIEDFLKREVKKAGFERVVVAVSGGVDSGTVLTLCVRALGREKVLVALMPYGDLNPEGVKDSYGLLKEIKLPKENIFQVDIKPVVETIEYEIQNFPKSAYLEPEAYSLALSRGASTGLTRCNARETRKQQVEQNSKSLKGDDLIRRGNVMARVRMIVLFDLAKANKALVCGTENKTEHLLGYYTRFGDEASDLEPIRGLYKTQVVQLAKYLDVPETIIYKKPTAGLWEGQTDEGELGFSYEEADQILYFHFDDKARWEDIKRKVQSAKCKVNEKSIERVRGWVERNEFKHDLPYSVH